MADTVGALANVRKADWETQETCFVTLLKILQNIKNSPTEAKFRRLKLSNAALKSKVFDVLGAQDFLIAAGFVEAGEFLELADGEEANAVIIEALAVLQKQADDANMDQLRKERDERIAKQKEEDAKDKHRLKGHAHLSPEEQAALKEQMDRDRAELEAARENRPVQDSKAWKSDFGAKMGDTSFLRPKGG